MIAGKIDVSKIDKAALFKGAKGTYLDIILFETPDDKFGNDYRITQGISKERRDAGERGPIIGNAKIVGQGKPAASKPAPKTAPKQEKLDEDVPF